MIMLKITNINDTKKFEEETNVEKEFKCHICDRIYGPKKNLNKHLKSHTGTKIENGLHYFVMENEIKQNCVEKSKLFSCPVCQKVLNTNKIYRDI